jgi:hypothetical protein
VALLGEKMGELMEHEEPVGDPFGFADTDPAEVGILGPCVGVRLGAEAGPDAPGDAAAEEEASELGMALQAGGPVLFRKPAAWSRHG